MENQNQKTETCEKMCLSSKEIIAAVPENNSGVFTTEFQVVTSNNISVGYAFFPVNIVKLLVLNILLIGPVN